MAKLCFFKATNAGIRTLLDATDIAAYITDSSVSNFRKLPRRMHSCPLITPKPRWTRRKTARPQELIAAALDLFVERGFAATRLEDVAALAGVSKGTLYLYFTSKEELFKAVVRENMIPLLGEAEDMIDRYPGHSAELFREIMMGWWAKIGDTKLSGITKLMLAESGNFPEVARFYHEEVIIRANRMVMRLLERGMARGEFRTLDVTQATHVIIAPVLMLMLWNHSFNPSRPESIAPQAYLQCLIDLLLNGMAAPQPPQPLV